MNDQNRTPATPQPDPDLSGKGAQPGDGPGRPENSEAPRFIDDADESGQQRASRPNGPRRAPRSTPIIFDDPTFRAPPRPAALPTPTDRPQSAADRPTPPESDAPSSLTQGPAAIPTAPDTPQATRTGSEAAAPAAPTPPDHQITASATAASGEAPPEPAAEAPGPTAEPAPTPTEDQPNRRPTPLPAGSKRALREQRFRMAEAQRPPRRGRYTLVAVLSATRSLIIVFGVAVMVATIFSSFTGNDSLSLRAQQNLAIAYSTQARVAAAPSAIPTSPRANRIGFIRGHSGIAQRGPTQGGVDPGAVCNDDQTITELSVTTAVGDRVIAALRGRGYTVDALDEWDMRLVDPKQTYEAAALVSIHADSCENFNDGYNHTGFKVAGPEGRLTVRDQDVRLADCLRDEYAKATGLKYSEYTVTNNMLYYHAFREVSQRTPAAILELGFLYYDRETLTKKQDEVAQGVVNGLLCFLDPKALLTPTAAPIAAAPVTPVPGPAQSTASP